MPAPKPGLVDVSAVIGDALGSDEVHARPASLWRRALATTIDALILCALIAGYMFAAASVAGIHSLPEKAFGLDAIVQVLQAWSKILVPGAVLAVVLGFVYSALFAFVWNGCSPGRKLAGIRLVDARGRAPSPARAVLRAALSLLSLALLLAGFWLALFDRHGQTLHDKLARTWWVQPSL